MADATVAEEEYLQTIFWLQEAGLPMTGANVARAMQLSAPTVHEMVGRLERDGYITRGADKSISFTDEGREHAETVVRRHRLIERFLTDVLKIPWDDVHEEAERLEHAMSPIPRGADDGRDRGREDLPARPPDRARARGSRASRSATPRRARRSPSCASRTRPRTCCTCSSARAWSPGARASCRDGRRRAHHGRLRRRDRDAHPLASPRRSRCSPIPSPPPRIALPEQLVLGKERYGR